MKRKLVGLSLAAGLAAIPVGVAVAATTSSNVALCTVGVQIVKRPGVNTNNGVVVETGEYRKVNTCTAL